jgi:hypothetical protein
MRLLAAATLVICLVLGCQSPESSAPDASTTAPPSAAAIIDSAVVAHGDTVLNRAVIRFTFRGDRYRVRQHEGRFHYRRSYTDSLGRTVQEGLTNDTLYRVVDGDTVSLSDDERDAVETTVNSVTYFSLLPGPLQDDAVQPEYSGRDTIDGRPYHRIRVTFQQEGGGKDWEDIFMYWFRTDTYEMDYLSYAFGLGDEETDVGTRFREAYDVRRINSVRMADYMNYTRESLPPDQMARYPTLWAQDSLELVSRIETDSVSIRLLSPDA